MDAKKTEIKELKRLHREFSHAAKHLFGYTISLLFDYSKLYKFLNFPINNIGDPFSQPSNLKINTLQIERKVIDRLAKLFHLKNNEHWGYVTNGGTEGNLYGLYLARELYPKGIVFLSDQTHYSAMKNIRLLRMPYIMVGSLANGEIDYDALEKELAANQQMGPPIFFVNIGTTMKGAIDDLKKIHRIISKLKISEYYIHCDAAFYGMVLPFISEVKPFDFRAGIDSIAISGHKMIGSPIPCGVVITKKSHVDKISTSIEYVGIKDTTISGSRNGITPLFLWHELVYSCQKKFKKKVQSCFEKANYIIERFHKHGIHAWRNPGSLTIVLPCPSKKIAKKWQLPTQGDICCMIALPQLTKRKIDQFIKEFAADV
ncbi:MAG TPA: histidine decarboxylase [Chlamydiales bacterium]|nr:histidine decarboxylase [Chlamydiales bacterium]